MTNSKTSYFTILLATLAAGFAIGYFFHGDCPGGLQPNVTPSFQTPCSTCYASDCSVPFDGIDAGLAKLLVSNYHDHHLAAINQNCSTVPSGGDSRSVWFSLERVKRFIYQIESKACNMCNNEKPALGIRIYFGEYPTDATQAPDINADYLGLHTLLMVPTYDDGVSNRDFDPAYINEGCHPAPLDSVGAVLTALPPDPQRPDQSNMNMRNHGYLFPPPYPNANCPLNKSEYLGADFMYYVDNAVCPQ